MSESAVNAHWSQNTEYTAELFKFDFSYVEFQPLFYFRQIAEKTCKYIE